MTNLIDQNEHLDWVAFSDEPLNCYQMSEFQLVFAGDTKCYADPEWSDYQDEPTPYAFNIYDENFYKKDYGPGVTINKNPPCRAKCIAEVSWRHMVPYGTDIAIVGYCKAVIGLYYSDLRAYDLISNLKNKDDLERFILQTSYDRYEGDPAFIYAKSKNDLEVVDINGRTWIRHTEGCHKLQREYIFQTPLTGNHLVYVMFCPSGHWEAGTDPDEKMLNKVMASFWEFMDNLNIIEPTQAMEKKEPGQELRGKSLRDAEEEVRSQADPGEQQAESNFEDGW